MADALNLSVLKRHDPAVEEVRERKAAVCAVAGKSQCVERALRS
jgi:hypothetical protein